MPVIDGIKTVAQCVETGIEQGKQDVRDVKQQLNKAKFDDANSNAEALGVSVSYDPNLFKGNDTK